MSDDGKTIEMGWIGNATMCAVGCELAEVGPRWKWPDLVARMELVVQWGMGWGGVLDGEWVVQRAPDDGRTLTWPDVTRSPIPTATIGLLTCCCCW